MNVHSGNVKVGFCVGSELYNTLELHRIIIIKAIKMPVGLT